MSTNRTERLLNLVIALSATTRWLTKEQIRHAVPQYETSESLEAFDRMFERDKEDLREMGVPLLTSSVDDWFDDEVGYRIDRDAYSLPPVDLSPAELSVLALASRVWQQATLAGPAARAVTKLKALGVRMEEDLLTGLEPRVSAGEAAFAPIFEAVRDRAPIGFGYRKPSGSGEPEPRRVEPWRLANRRGRWYVIGFDRDREAQRVFRLSRIVGSVRRIGPVNSVEVPDLDRDLELVFPEHDSDPRQALIAVAPGRAWALRLRAARVSDSPSMADHASDQQVTETWDEIEVPIDSLERLADELAGYAGDVRVLGPEDLAAAVRDRLDAALQAHAHHAEAAQAVTQGVNR